MTEFARTTCACTSCIECCKRQPGPLAPGDFERIAEFLHSPAEAFANLRWTMSPATSWKPRA